MIRDADHWSGVMIVGCSFAHSGCSRQLEIISKDSKLWQQRILLNSNESLQEADVFFVQNNSSERCSVELSGKLVGLLVIPQRSPQKLGWICRKPWSTVQSLVRQGITVWISLYALIWSFRVWLNFFLGRIETVGQPDRRDSLGVCVEQQNGYDSLQRDKAVCVSTNGESESCNWRMWSFFFPKTHSPWFFISLGHTWATPSPFYVQSKYLVRSQISFSCLQLLQPVWRDKKEPDRVAFHFYLPAKKEGDTVLPVRMYRKGEMTFAVLTVSGAVFVNGKEMTNQLPAVTSGSTVTFDMEVVQLGPPSNEGGNFKLRVTISSNNREVVFDWVLDQSCLSLYFGCSFSYPGWKVLVF